MIVVFRKLIENTSFYNLAAVNVYRQIWLCHLTFNRTYVHFVTGALQVFHDDDDDDSQLCAVAVDLYDSSR